MREQPKRESLHLQPLARWILGGAVASLVACGSVVDPGPARETVLPLLQQEALLLKRDGENISPKLEVEMTWQINSVQVREQANDETNPWAGSIDITIISRIKELDGYITERTDKTFHYMWNDDIEKWLAQ